MTVVGNDILISVDGVDYTNKIVSYTESGGTKKVKHIKTMGNSYKTVVCGRDDYMVTLRYKNDSINVDTLFEDDTGVDIDIGMGTGSIAYTNMFPKDYTNDISPNASAYITIVYSASAYDTSGNSNREVL